MAVADEFPGRPTDRRCDFFLLKGAGGVGSIVRDGGGCCALNVGCGRGTLVRRFKSGSECDPLLVRGLSFHPDVRRSSSERMIALGSAWAQGSDGKWHSEYLSTRFGYLTRIEHPIPALPVRPVAHS